MKLETIAGAIIGYFRRKKKAGVIWKEREKKDGITTAFSIWVEISIALELWFLAAFSVFCINTCIKGEII